VFAYLQSAAMGGYGVAAVNGITRACAAMSGATAAMLWWLAGRSDEGDKRIRQPMSQ
jgi:hypothetical protein